MITRRKILQLISLCLPIKLFGKEKSKRSTIPSVPGIYSICNLLDHIQVSIDQKHLKNGRWDILAQALQLLQDSFQKKDPNAYFNLEELRNTLFKNNIICYKELTSCTLLDSTDNYIQAPSITTTCVPDCDRVNIIATNINNKVVFDVKLT